MPHRMIPEFWEHTNTAYAYVSREGFFLKVNPAWETLTGYSEAELEGGMKWQDITLAQDLKYDEQMTRKVLAGERDSYTMDKTYIRKPPKNGLQPVCLKVVRAPEDCPVEHAALLAFVNARDPKAIVNKDNGTMSVQASEGELRVGWDAQKIGMLGTLVAALIGWVGTVIYAVRTVEDNKAEIRDLRSALYTDEGKER